MRVMARSRASQRMYGAMLFSMIPNSLTDKASCRKAAVARCGVYSPTAPSEPCGVGSPQAPSPGAITDHAAAHSGALRLVCSRPRLTWKLVRIIGIEPTTNAGVKGQ
jgi:hypothetical protein